MKKKVLVITGRYLPGYKDGGPLRSIVNLIDHLADEFDFYVLTADRDHGDTEPYPGITHGEWTNVRGAQVMYVEPGGFSKETVLLAAQGMNAVFMCGCFNDYARTTLSLRKTGRISCSVFVASMGLFSPAALQIHKAKKLLYINLLKVLGYFKKVSWVATSKQEMLYIQDTIGRNSNIHIVQDLPRAISEESFNRIQKDKGSLKVAFLSRIDISKNLCFAIKMLERFEGNIELNIYGAVHSEEYWNKCKEELEKVHYIWNYHGEINSEKVAEAFSENHIFFLPTLGENYGHVIIEAMSAGRPVVISDRTPWKDLRENGAGFAVPLEKEEEFVSALSYYLEMPDEEYIGQCINAFEYAMNVAANPKGKTQFIEMMAKVN